RPRSARSPSPQAPPGAAPRRSYSPLLRQGLGPARVEVGQGHLVPRTDVGAIGEHARRLARVAETGHDEHGLAHVLLGGVAADGHDAAQPRADRRAQAVARVLDDDRVVTGEPELL